MTACRVCRDGDCIPFRQIGPQTYWRCQTCLATLLDSAQMPGPEAERAHYGHHQNHVDDPGYRRFLSKLAQPLLARLSPGVRGLDYGCGPGPALAAMMEEAGHPMAVWDPVFAPDPAPLARTYDVITCSEVAEHFHAPADAFDHLDGLLRPGGWLGVMTCFQTEDARFADWHYRKDPTHVVFYKTETFAVIARQRGWSCEIPAKDIALMRKAV